jgi:hypothetical protein
MAKPRYSDRDIERAHHWIVRAIDALEEARVLIPSGRTRLGAYSRLYYSAHHAAVALLRLIGHSAKTHDAIKNQFGVEWVRRKGFPARYGQILKSGPVWLGDLGDLVGYREPPHHSKFQLLYKSHGILLTGSPDGVLIRSDGSHVIVDYKTAKYTDTQDELYPMYEAQLNAYALLGEQCGFAPVAGLALIYMEPVTDQDAAAEDGNHLEDGFAMGFRANVQPVTINRGLVERLMVTTRKIFDRASAPPGREGCKDCGLVDALVQVART